MPKKPMKIKPKAIPRDKPKARNRRIGTVKAIANKMPDSVRRIISRMTHSNTANATRLMILTTEREEKPILFCPSSGSFMSTKY